MEENKVTETSVEENKVASNQEEGAKVEGKKNFKGQKNSSQRGGRKFDKNKKERREPVVKEFEERVSPYILLDAYEDKHGIGKQLLAKVKNIFGKEEEK